MRKDAVMDETLSAADLERLRKDFSANPAYRLAQNAVTRVTIDDVAINREIVSSIDHSLSTTLDDWKATDQERSGRCWLFAGMNLLRVGVMRKIGLKNFEFSQNWRCSGTSWSTPTTSWRRSSRPRTGTSTTARSPTSWRLRNDGGQWNMFVNLVPSTAWCPRATCRRR